LPFGVWTRGGQRTTHPPQEVALLGVVLDILNLIH